MPYSSRRRPNQDPQGTRRVLQHPPRLDEGWTLPGKVAKEFSLAVRRAPDVHLKGGFAQIGAARIQCRREPRRASLAHLVRSRGAAKDVSDPDLARILRVSLACARRMHPYSARPRT